jgi:phosphopantetheinyl transferase
MRAACPPMWGERAASIRHRIFTVAPNVALLSWPEIELQAGSSLALLVPAAGAMQSPPGAVRSAAVHALVRKVLVHLTQVAPSALRIAKTQRGKPYLERANPIRFNVSHARAYSLVALSHAGEIGCDIEDRFDADDVDRLGPLVLHAQELEALVHVHGAERQDALRRCWVRKEALLKAAGSGFLEDPRNVLAQDARLALHECEVAPGCSAAVASADAACTWHLLAEP